MLLLLLFLIIFFPFSLSPFIQDLEAGRGKWGGGGGGEASDPEFPLLFQENPASRTFIYRFPESRFLFLKNIH